MCGIAGYITNSTAFPAKREIIQAMTDTISHRGPDSADVWVEPQTGTALGHRRLAIIDLSPNGHQPMLSACGRYVIVYNGEVYNYAEIREELIRHGHSFRGDSDTEVILSAIAQWGLRRAIERFIGMFAFALWDKEKKSLSLVRDRLGIKPLYYGFSGSVFLFGSELKAIRRHPAFTNEINRNALALYFRHNYIPAPYSIFEGIYKLRPGHICTVGQNQAAPLLEEYWSAKDAWQAGLDSPYEGTTAEAVEDLEVLLKDAVGQRMISDVPLGAFLSGGIDSSAVVALMQAQSSRPVKTFSIGFHEEKFNEAKHAKAVAAHLGTDHTELYLTPADLLNVVPNIPEHWDEPFADSSQIPTYCVSKLAKENVTVSLSGDGGDELFTGYQRYFALDNWHTLERIPLPVRRLTAATLKKIPAKLFDILGPIGSKIHWRLDMLSISSFSEFYRYFVSHHKNPESLVRDSKELITALTDNNNKMAGDLFKQMTYWDIVSYLPDDILTKVDRASMAVSLEARVPLLDHRVVEFAGKLPTSYKVRDGQSKWLLRQVLYKYVPKELIERPKMGFGVPIDSWLKHDLREWAEDSLSADNLTSQGYLDVKAVRTMWSDYKKGQNNWHYYLWDILMFQSWLEHARI